MPLPPLWIADQVRNDVTMLSIVFTLTFDSSPIKGEGDMIGWCWLVHPCHPALWFEESLIMLFQRGRFQRRRTSFFIILVPMNGRVKSAMTGQVDYGSG